MNQTHQKVPLAGIPEGYALLSNHKGKNIAIVFVHGFGGHPLKTWLYFQCMIQSLAVEYPWFRNSDLYFYGYTNFDKLPQANATDCLKFIRRVFPSPSRNLFEFDTNSSPSPSVENRQALIEATYSLVPPSYEHLVLVGHSVGGVILRIGLWQEFKRAKTMTRHSKGQLYPDPKLDQRFLKREKMLGADLCLFAPAHIGTSKSSVLSIITDLIEGIPVVGKPLAALLESRVPVAPTLRGANPILNDVRKWTEEYSEKHPDIHSLRARVLWGRERLLEAWEFKFDYPVEYVTNKGHVAVCKPSPSYTKPIDFLSYGHK